jgi:hypothetical protein
MRRRHGAAMMEAVMVAPVLGILLVGSMFLYHVYTETHELRLTARRCAWQHAMTGCGDKLPPGCQSYLGGASSAPTGDADSAQLRGLADGSDGEAVGGGLLSDIPLLGDAIDGLFGTTTIAQGEGDIATPWTGQARKMRGEMAVLCNTQPVDIGAEVEKMFCKLVPLGDCGE